jgi:hypothetical protein
VEERSLNSRHEALYECIYWLLAPSTPLQDLDETLTDDDGGGIGPSYLDGSGRTFSFLRGINPGSLSPQLCNYLSNNCPPK